MTKISVAIIGCGRVAGHHVRAINKNSNLDLAAISDLNEERMINLENISSAVPKYNNYHHMLKQHPEIDVVAVITPSGMHFEHALDVVSKYRKSVIIEKPVVMTLEQGYLLKEAAAQNFVHIFPVHQYRFNRCVQRIKKAICENELGRINLTAVRMRWCRPQNYYDRDPWRGTFAMDGGSCTNQGIHHLDLLRYLNGEVKRVNALMKTFEANIEAEDTVIAIVEFKNGALGTIEITTAARPNDFESSLSIIGNKGMAMLGGAFTDKLLEFSPKPEDKQEFSDNFCDAYGFGHETIYDGIVKTTLKSGDPAITFEDAIATMRFLHAIYVSAETNQWINVDEGLSSKRLGMPNEDLLNIYRTRAG
jgi:predicted dehydrogenase